jgi:hypothetical protein
MTPWTNDELSRIGTAEELQIATLRRDGTLRNPVTIWVVRVGDDLYVRAYKGRTSPWFRGVQTRHAGQIQAGGVVKEVTFVEETDPGINDEISAAYRTKYRRYAKNIVDTVLTSEAQAATIKLVPQDMRQGK